MNCINLIIGKINFTLIYEKLDFSIRDWMQEYLMI